MSNVNLRELLYEKAQKEQDDFIENYKNIPHENIVLDAYELVIRQDILLSLEDTSNLSDKQINALLKSGLILDNCYREWLKNDSTQMEVIRDTVSDFATKYAASIDENKNFLDYKTEGELKIYIDDIKKSTSDDIIDAVNLMQWDNGFLLEQPCKVNIKTMQVFDIEYDMETLNILENLQGEWIVIGGVRIPLFPKDEYDCSDKVAFWYGESDCMEEEKKDKHDNIIKKKYEPER